MKYPIKIYGNFIYDKPNSYQVLAYIADICNYKCEYCYNKFPRTGNLLNLSKLEQFITDILEQKDYLALDLIGGEPTLHPDLLDFCEKYKDSTNIELTVYTNLTKPLEYYKKLLSYNVQLIVSWHSAADNKIFVDKLKQFSEKERLQTSISIMFEHKYPDLSIETYKMILDLPKFNEKYFSLLAESENYKGYEYTDDQLKEFYNLMTLSNTQNTTILYNDGTKETVDDNFFFGHPENTNFKNWLCNAGKDYVYIHHNGDVTKCNEHDLIIIYNLNRSSTKFIIPTKPIICKLENCPCLFDIYKERLFKK